MEAITVASNGQVTLGQDVLDHLGIQPGDTVDVDKLPNGQVSLRARPTGKIQDFFGCLAGKSDVVLTIEEMNEVIARGWSGEL